MSFFFESTSVADHICRLFHRPKGRIPFTKPQLCQGARFFSFTVALKLRVICLLFLSKLFFYRLMTLSCLPRLFKALGMVMQLPPIDQTSQTKQQVRARTLEFQ